VIAHQLEFHLSTDAVGAEVDNLVKTAKDALLSAAYALETFGNQRDQNSIVSRIMTRIARHGG
jgi:hypothetical protein